MSEERNFLVKWNIMGLEGRLYENVPGLERRMIHEYVKFYDKFCEKANGGVTDMLNVEFCKLHPTYFVDMKDKECYELTLYNQFMADGYMKHIVNDLNASGEAVLLEFYVDPEEEVVFTGLLKAGKEIIEPHITINFSLVEK